MERDLGRRVIRRVPLDRVVPSREQPRHCFQEDSIEALAASIQRDGLLSPPMVRACEEGCYELIAGERRFRALKRLGAVSVDALVVEASDCEAAILSLVENLQREELHYLDEAEACRRLTCVHGLTQREVAQRLGRSQSAVANLIRLLALPEPVREMLRETALGSAMRGPFSVFPTSGSSLPRCAARRTKAWACARWRGAIARSLRVAPRPARIYCRDQRMFVNALLATVRSLNRAGVRGRQPRRRKAGQRGGNR